MAKRGRPRKVTRHRRKKNNYLFPVMGFIFIITGILGLIGYNANIFGTFFRGVGMFLMGSFYYIPLVLFIVLGGYLLFTNKFPKVFSLTKCGIYLVLIGILSFFNLDHLSSKAGVKEELISAFETLKIAISEKTNFSGGGMIGTLFSSLLNKYCGHLGAIIIICVIILIGAILITGITVSDIIEKLSEKFGNKDKDGNGIPDSEDEEDDDGYQDDENDELESTKVKISLSGNKNDKNVERPDYVPTYNTQLYKNYEPPYPNHVNEVLNDSKKNAKEKVKENEAEIKKNIPLLEKVLREFEVVAKVREVHVGPTVTQYELEIKSGTKMNKVKSLSSEIALAMAAKDVRIEAPIPGKSTVGIEIPNKINSAVPFREIIDAFPSEKASNKLLVALGKDIMGTPRYCEINKTPHLLVAGATGSGKSVCVNCIIGSILMRAKPDEVKMVMIDPKKVEFSGYNGLPHLLMPVVTDPRKASVALQKIVEEMEDRYRKFEDAKAKNIEMYNAMLEKKNKKMAEESQYPLLPYIVVIIDELADLMVIAKKEVEDSIVRITQMARAAGIHLIVATQRPSTDVITGLVKANIPSRISFAVSSQIDSRTILDMGGAEKLLGKGDMLFLPMGESVPQRIQGAFIDEEEVEKLVNYCCKGHSAVYDEKFNLDKVSESASSNRADVDNDDVLYNEVVKFVCTSKKASASLLQRRFKIGYNRAANLIDKLEERGIVGPEQGSKPREVLVELDEE